MEKIIIVEMMDYVIKRMLKIHLEEILVAEVLEEEAVREKALQLPTEMDSGKNLPVTPLAIRKELQFIIIPEMLELEQAIQSHCLQLTVETLLGIMLYRLMVRAS